MMKIKLLLLLTIFISYKASSGIVYQFEGSVTSHSYNNVDFFGLSTGDSILGTIVFDNTDGYRVHPDEKLYQATHVSVRTKNEVLNYNTNHVSVTGFNDIYLNFHALNRDVFGDSFQFSIPLPSLDLPTDEVLDNLGPNIGLGGLSKVDLQLGSFSTLYFKFDSYQINPQPSLPDNWVQVAIGDKIYRVASTIEEFNGVFDEQGRFIEVDRSTAGKLMAASQSIGELNDYDAIGIANSMEKMRQIAFTETLTDSAGLAISTVAGNAALVFNPATYIDPIGNTFTGLVTDVLTISNNVGKNSALYAIGVGSYEYALGLEDDSFTNVEAIINTKNSIEASINNPNVAVVIDSVISSREKMAIMQGAAVTAAEIWDDINVADSTNPFDNFFDNSFRAIGNVATSYAGGYVGVPSYAVTALDTRELVEEAFTSYGDMVNSIAPTPFNHLDIFEELAVDFGFTGENPVGLTPLVIQPVIPEGYVKLSPLPYGEAKVIEPFIDIDAFDFECLGEGTCRVFGDLDDPLIPGIGDNTWVGTFGSPVSFVLNDVLTPEQAFFINFDFMFDSSDSLINVYLNDILLDTLFSNDYDLNEFFTFNYLVNDPSLWGISTVFELFANGNTGNRVFYNDVQFLTLVKPQAEVSEPSALALFALSLIFLSSAYRKRRSKIY